jgi:hypothetical protein
MKSKCITVVVLLFLISCNETGIDKVKNSIPGTYVRPFDNEFYKGVDTLQIESLTGETFRIYNYGAFFQKSNGTEKREKEIWIAVYNTENHLLYESRQGKVISLDLEQQLLYVGGSQYKKIQ